MDEYINRRTTYDDMFWELRRTGYQSNALHVITKQPAEDVATVRHGKWAVMHGVMTPGSDPLLYCPYCNSRDSEHMGGIEMPKNWNWCPVCGVKMDLEE